MGSTEAKAYFASPEAVAACALNGKISGPGWYEQQIGVEKVVLGEGNGIPEEDRAVSPVEAHDKIIAEADSIISGAENSILDTEAVTEDDGALTKILPGFPEKLEEEIVFCDADSLNTDAIYPGKYTYLDDISVEKMAEVCMENYDKSFGRVAREGPFLCLAFLTPGAAAPERKPPRPFLQRKCQ